MTTDTFPKLRARELSFGDGRICRIAGIDKGAGMIHPDMAGPSPPPHATLLGCIATDAPVAPAALQAALDYAVQRSFNAISIDGDMSTNDTVVLFANGATEEGSAAQGEIDEARDPAAFACFRDGLTEFMQELAQLVVRDGEGATKFVTISVEVRLVAKSAPVKLLIPCSRVLGRMKMHTKSPRRFQHLPWSRRRSTAKMPSKSRPFPCRSMTDRLAAGVAS